MSDPIAFASHTVRGAHDGPHLVITGGVHGDEFEPMAAVRRLIATWPAVETRGRVTLVPVVNEPAFARRDRTADDGLDLARTCPGDPRGTITQRIAHALSGLIGTADFYIDLHTGGTTLKLLPLAGYVLHRQRDILERQRQMARAMNLTVVWGTSPNLEGRSLSVARDAGIPAIYAEYGGGASCDPEAVAAYVRGCLNVAAAIGMLDRPAEQKPIRYTIEDSRQESGHLQVQHPAPAAGFFEPQVDLGDEVEAGQPIGQIVDPLGNTMAVIPAAEAGVVLMLRICPSVAKGDPLAAVERISGGGP